MSDERRKVWATILYPESMPADWKERLERTRVPILVSPIHDKDVWTMEDQETNPNHVAGTLKKPHYHVVMQFESLKSPAQVQKVVEPLGVKYVEPVESPRAYARYLAHLDQPNKAQYNQDEILKLNGAVCDLSEPIPSKDEQETMRREICQVIRDNNITEYFDLVNYADDFGKPGWSWYVATHTVMFDRYVSSFRNKLAQGTNQGD